MPQELPNILTDYQPPDIAGKPGDAPNKGSVDKEDGATVDLPESGIDAPDAQETAKRTE